MYTIIITSVFFIIFSKFIPQVSCHLKTCHPNLKVDISEGTVSPDQSILKNGKHYPKVSHFQENTTTFSCICNFKTCIRKCCPDHQIMSMNKTCVDNDFQFSLPKSFHHDEEYLGFFDISTEVISGDKCVDSYRYKLKPQNPHNERFFIQKDGELYVPRFDVERFKVHDYCVEGFLEEDNNVTFTALICLYDSVEEEIFRMGM